MSEATSEELEDQRVADAINRILEDSGRTQMVSPVWVLVPGTNAFAMIINICVQKKPPPKIAVPGELERASIIGNAVRNERLSRLGGNGAL